MIIDRQKLRHEDLRPIYSKHSNKINGTYLGCLKIYDRTNQMNQQIKSQIANLRYQCYNFNDKGNIELWKGYAVQKIA